MASKGGAPAIVPTRVAHLFAPIFGLASVLIPIQLEPVQVHLIWQAADEHDPAGGWLR